MRGIVIGFLIAGLLAGWGSGPAAAVPPVTPSPAGAQETDAALATWRAEPPTWQEDFAAPTPLWPAGEGDGSSRYVAQGAYHVAVADRRTLSLAISPRRAAAFLFEAGARQVSGPLDSEYGLLFGCQEGQNCYFFAVSSDGYFLLDVWREGKRMSLIEPASAPPAALHTGLDAVNRLGVAVQDAVITLYANDVALASRYDAQWQPGYIGAGVATNRQGGAEVIFDDVHLWLGQGEPADGQGGIGDLLANLPTVPAVPAAAPAPTPPGAPAPVQTPAPAGSLAASLAALRATPPTWQEAFDADNDQWFTGFPESGSCDYQEGGLALTLDGADPNWCGHFEEDFDLPANYLLEVTAAEIAHSAQSAPPALVCLWFGRHGLGGYEFCTGPARYSLSHIYEDGTVNLLVGPALTTAVKIEQGAQNRFGVLVEGTTVTLLINEQIVQSYEDEEASWNGGEVGLMAATEDPDGSTVLFDDLRLWAVTAPPDHGGAGPAAPAPSPMPLAAPKLADLPIFWDALLENFAVSNRQIEEVLEPGHKIPDYYVTFDFEVIAATRPNYFVEFLDKSDNVKRTSAIEFVMAPDTPASLITFTGGWLAGVKGKAKFALPRDFAKYPSIVIVRADY